MRLAGKVILATAFVLLLAALGTGTAWAQDAGSLTTQDAGATVYGSDSYSWQVGQSPTTVVKSSSNYWWRAGSYVLYSAESTIGADVDAIAGYYSAAFPSLKLQKIQEAQVPDVVFYDWNTTFPEPARPSDCGDYGCYLPVATSYIPYDNAYWPMEGRIWVNHNQPTQVKRNVIAHEIGHLYGLDEGYLEDSAYTSLAFCNHAAPASVMDAIGCDGSLDSPTPYDRQNITAYWSAQPPTVMSAAASGSNMVHLWKSNGYTEREGLYNGEYWNGSSFQSYTNGWQPLYAYQGQISFKWMDWRTALNTFTTSLPPLSPHRMCIQTWSAGINGWSPVACRTYPSTRLVGLWTFDEGSGSTANDSSGYGNHGTLYSGPQWVAGRVGPYALSFDGVNDYVGIPHSSTLPFLTTSPWTISQWVNYQGNNTYYPQFSKGSTTYGFTLHGSDGRIQGGDGASHTFDVYTMFGGLVGQGWKHTVITYDGAIFRAYVDGVAKGTFAWSYGISSPDEGILLGAFWGPYYQGLMDQVRIYDRALTAGEVADLYNNP